MSGKWIEITRLTFKGDRFRDHALDLSALPELGQFQKIVAETAKVLWRAKHPGKNLPRHFERQSRLYLRRVEEGSAIAPLEAFIEESGAPEFWESEPDQIKLAVAAAEQVFEAVERDSPIPEEIPRELLEEFAKFGRELEEDECIIIPITTSHEGKQTTRVTRETQGRVARIMAVPSVAKLDLEGEVLEADIRQGKCQLWINGSQRVIVDFSPEDECRILQAMVKHATCKLRVIGVGKVSPQGKPLQITQVESLQLFESDSDFFDPSSPSIEDQMAEIAAQVPIESWNKLPGDLTDHLDHYLYGTAKK